MSPPPVTAILGPTNTGKTHLAVERLCAHSSGMMGFPLRLLAREVYDRVVAMKGESRVALITGEEKILPRDARYYLCTVEAMPMAQDFAFVAVDEVQLGNDPERGHIFTDRLLHARGREETMLLGSASVGKLIRKLLPEAEIITRPRFSTLSYAPPRKLSRLPKRSAIVAFSVEDVYAIAEMLRRTHGGAAIVMGALSPQTRNAQVAMYQAGEVDYLVATDAIGMGLNLDVSHIAFAALHKFDGVRKRRLTLAEMGQIAGRAGRHQRDGSFSTLSGGDVLTPEEIIALEAHNFPALDWLYWRDATPDCSSLDTLIRALETPPRDPLLNTAPEAIDLAVLKRLAEMPAVAATARGQVARLWAAASIPDFRKLGPEHQARFVASLWAHLGNRNGGGSGRIPHGMMAQEITRLDNVTGDIATLAGRIAAARTWAYIAEKPDWVADGEDFRGRTRALDMRLSDAMHRLLTERFVDKRARILLRGLQNPHDASDIAVEADGAVLVEGTQIGIMKGFAFAGLGGNSTDRRQLRNAAEPVLRRVIQEKAAALSNAPDSALMITADANGTPAVVWDGNVLATLVKGKTLLTPELRMDRAIKELPDDLAKIVTARIEHWLAAMLAKHLEGLIALDKSATAPDTPPPVRALLTQVVEQGGVIERQKVEPAILAIPKEERGFARKAGLVFGALDIFHHALMKPGAMLWRAALFAAWEGLPMAALPPDNAVHLVTVPGDPRLGFRQAGEAWLRLDMAERLVKEAHAARATGPQFAIDPAFATSLGLSPETHAAVLTQAGFAPIAAKGTDDAETPGPQLWRWAPQALRAAKQASRGPHKPSRKPTRKAAAAHKLPPVIQPSAGNAFAALASLREKLGG